MRNVCFMLQVIIKVKQQMKLCIPGEEQGRHLIFHVKILQTNKMEIKVISMPQEKIY